MKRYLFLLYVCLVANSGLWGVDETAQKQLSLPVIAWLHRYLTDPMKNISEVETLQTGHDEEIDEILFLREGLLCLAEQARMHGNTYLAERLLTITSDCRQLYELLNDEDALEKITGEKELFPN